MSIRLLRLIPSLAAGALLALAGCAAESSPAGSGGGKADDLAECDDGICVCGDDAFFIAKARADLTASDPELYPATAWSDDEAQVIYDLGDLDADGMADPVVGPGRQYSGGSFTYVIYLTAATGCPSTPAAVIEARDLGLAEDGKTTNGIADLESYSIWDCEVTVTRFIADAKGTYQEFAGEPVNICEEDDSGLPEDDLGTEQPE